ncbi:3-hydroxyisobutyrate dehydrogenase [Pseudarthrobacter equi]|uniref:3-hydroxyisobutyrate dehydrogenase n=2 Tax=Pseudarthrobacter equi TaxID=728066 RepID=A0A1H2BKX6_9MICC|nr:NAD(P)-dependent oxidoreductase [Pseudarthrobacter equi]SDT58881.1 3-hydroxyisobutyrate dehydrogenase [Pseudarthrobacter equi]
MNEPQNRRIAVIGLGAMGGAMAATLHKAGWEVTGFDPSDAARAAAASTGISTTDSLAAVAGTPYAVLSLPAASIVETTVPQLLATPGTVAIVDTTTSEPATSKTMAGLAEAQGAAFIDAPVSGGRDGAATGTLSAFVGATDAALAGAEPVLLALTGGNYSHIGGPGSGNVVKLLNNVLAAANLASVGEALGVAKAYGIDPATAAASISGASGGSKVSANMYPNWVLTGTHDSGFSMGLMARDASLAVDLAEQIGEKPALLATVANQWQDALAVLGPKADFTEIARTVAPAITPAGAPGAEAGTGEAISPETAASTGTKTSPATPEASSPAA